MHALGLVVVVPRGLVVVDAFAPLQSTVIRPLPAVRSATTIRFATIPEKGEKQVQETPPTADYFSSAKSLSLFEGVPYEQLTIGVLKEDLEGENRVSQTPDTVRNLVKSGFTVVVEQNGKFS